MPYHSYATLEEDMRGLARSHPNLCSLYSIGTSWQGRRIYCLKIGSGERSLLLVGTHHGNEWIGTEMPFLWADFLLRNYATQPDVRRIVQGTKTYAVPMLNPDGHEARTRKNAHGVDLNRNYDYKWCGGGSSSDPYSQVYKGPAPFSEPETRAITQIRPSWAVSFHSGTERLAYPWGCTYDPPPDKAEYDRTVNEANAEIRRRGGSPYTAGQISTGAEIVPDLEGRPAFVIYIATGTFEDYFYNIGTKTLVLELTSSYIPPDSSIGPVFNRQFGLGIVLYSKLLGVAPGPSIWRFLGLELTSAMILGTVVLAGEKG